MYFTSHKNPEPKSSSNCGGGQCPVPATPATDPHPGIQETDFTGAKELQGDGDAIALFRLRRQPEELLPVR